MISPTLTRHIPTLHRTLLLPYDNACHRSPLSLCSSEFIWRSLLKKFLVTVFGSCFYTGFFPVAPATFACAIWLLVWLFVPGGRLLTHPIALAASLPLAIYLSFVMEGYYGQDASQIVIDEFVGMQVTLFMFEPSWKAGLAGFFLFRFFDIAKPFPVGRSQRLKGGFGVVVDDVLAGIYSYAALYILGRFLDLG